MTVNNIEKVEVFARQFSNVFVKEPDGEPPKGTQEAVTPLREMKITKKENKENYTEER